MTVALYLEGDLCHARTCPKQDAAAESTNIGICQRQRLLSSLPFLSIVAATQACRQRAAHPYSPLLTASSTRGALRAWSHPTLTVVGVNDHAQVPISPVVWAAAVPIPRGVCLCAVRHGGVGVEFGFACVCRQLFIALVGTSGARSSMRVPTPHGIHNRPTLLHDTLPDLTITTVC